MRISARCVATLIAITCSGGSASGQAVTYQLGHAAAYEIEGCLAPCLCPGFHEQGPATGTFDLVFIESDPHFDYYAIRQVHFTAEVAHGVRVISGSGRYVIGGVHGAENRMTLELRIDGEGPFEFDSGLVPVAAAFPNIEISIDAAPVCREITVSVVAGESPLNCYADCDRSTGAGVLDIFDFLCFQNAFVSQREYACDCDTSSGHGVCDLFDFLCFQGAFVGGCP